MRIIIDNKIPYIHEAVLQLTTDVVYVEGREFTPELVREADVLIVRTRTQCDRRLLEGSNVKLIATATIGFDHIDTAYCHEAGIKWVNAPGCNAASVAQYIESCLMLLKMARLEDLTRYTLGVVGVGNVGKKIADLGTQLGMRVLLNDPPRAEQEGPDGFVSLQQIAEECDIISFHTPLNRGGAHNTFHLANEEFFGQLKRRPVIINSGRGEVIKTEILKAAMDRQLVSEVILDVWENEPSIDLELLSRVVIGTPHIAGYSADGKANATRMALEAVAAFYGLNMTFNITPPAPPQSIIKVDSYDEAILRIYDPRNDCDALRQAPDKFEYLRGHYPLRREKQAYQFDID